MARHGEEMGSIGAWAQRMTAGKRPALVGVLAAGVVALGASTAVAASSFDRVPPRPLTIGGPGTHMMGGNGTNMMAAQDTHMTGGNVTSMMGAKGTHMTGTKDTNMMGGKSH